MEKNAEFIRTKEFHIVFKGYKTDDVDKFLDIVSVEFDRLIKKNRELQDNLDRLKYENNKEQEEDSDIKKIIQDALISAHKVAEDIKSQANREAEELLEKRKEEEQDIIKSMETRKVEMEKSILILQNKYSEFKEKIRQMSEQLNELTEEAEVGFVVHEEPLEQEQEEISEDSEEEAMHPEEDEAEEEVTQPENIEEEKEVDDFEGNVIRNKRQDGFYFDKKKEPDTSMTSENIQEQAEVDSTDLTEVADTSSIQGETAAPEFTEKAQETEKEYNIEEKSSIEQTEEISGEEGEKIETLKERKKIDIANPDIIESFFKPSDD